MQTPPASAGPPSGADATLDRARLQACRYVTVEEAASYPAVIDIFTDGVAGLLSDLSAAEVQAALGERGFELDLETVDARLTYLVGHGNLMRSPREAEARTIREYLTARARFQIAPLGEIVHRQVLELLVTAGQAREVSTEVLPELLRGLRALAEPSRASAGAITALFAAHQQLVQSTRAFYVGLGEALARVDLDAETLAAYREMLIDYLQRFVEDVRRYQPLIVEALDALNVDEVLAATDSAPGCSTRRGRPPGVRPGSNAKTGPASISGSAVRRRDPATLTRCARWPPGRWAHCWWGCGERSAAPGSAADGAICCAWRAPSPGATTSPPTETIVHNPESKRLP